MARTLAEVEKELTEVVKQIHASVPGAWNKRGDSAFQARQTELSTKFDALVAEKDYLGGFAGKKMVVDLAGAGIGEGHERPAKKYYPPMPGEIDEEAKRGF